MSFYEFDDENTVDENDAIGLTDFGRAIVDDIDDSPCDVRWDAALGVHRCFECGTPFFSLHEIADRISSTALATIDILAESAGIETEDTQPSGFDIFVIDSNGIASLS